MAGHSQYKNIMYRKGAQDAKRAKKFAKITREIIIAIKSGLADSEANPRLRAALTLARASNMPKDNIERAIKRATGEGDTTSYEEVRYEGYGPGGVAIIIESLTDNRNRTASEVRSTLTKYGGNLGETGSVNFHFERLGLIRFPKTVCSFDKVFEAAVEAGADNVEEMSDFYEVTTTIEQFGHVRDNLIKCLGDFEEASIIWRPLNTISVNETTAKTLMKLIDTLEDNDDVQHVYANFEMDEEVMQKLLPL